MIVAGAQLGHYRILSRIGAGGMGEVWLADDTRLERKVAIKLLPAASTKDADRVRRFEQEARSASALNHPNIVTIHEIGEAEAGHFIVMEYVQGRTLRSLINERPAMEAIISWGKQIARALGVAHASGIVHRDIKPENIMVRADGYVKVLDFGLARLATAGRESEGESPEGTNPGVLLGTAAYMSPEQARSEPASSASDIFSLGIVLYEMAAGSRPFRANSMLGMLQAITTELPTPPSRLNSGIPEPLDSIIIQMLEKSAEHRPTASDVVAAMRAAKRWRPGGPERSLEEETNRQMEAENEFFLNPSLGITVSKPRVRHTVGREKERAELRSAFVSADAGRGLMICVAGEPGIGKTSLVEDFLNEIVDRGEDCLVARGLCSERLAGAEGYLPWLEAMGCLLRGGDSSMQARTMQFGAPSIPQKMRQLAPTWYAQIAPSSMGESSAAQLQAQRAVSQERMKRELAEFVDEVSRSQPMILFFEDLQWADASTIDLLGYLAGRFAGLRVMIVATYRPSDMMLAKHPFLQLKPELQSRGLCHEIALEFLSREEVEKYLALEFPGHGFPRELPELIFSKTEGNPLFMADLVGYLSDRGVIAKEETSRGGGAPGWTLAQSLPGIEQDLPESVRGMIERKIARIGEEALDLLVAACVQGYEFDSAVIAKAMETDPDDVEERLENLDRVHGLVRLIGEKEFPDNTLTLHYRFVHLLYQNALYSQLRPTKRAALSGAVAEALRGHYGKKAASVASTLAVLYEAARNWMRASEYFLIASRNALRGFANQESIVLANRGLKMLEKVSDSDERAVLEVRLQTTLGLSLMMVKGYAASEVLQNHIRTVELCERHGDQTQLFQAQFGLSVVRVVRGDYERARELAEHSLQIAQSVQDPALLVQAHWALGLSGQYLGELLSAREHFEQTIALYDQKLHGHQILLYGAILNRAHLGRLLLYLGFPDRSRKAIDEAAALARETKNTLGLCNTMSIACFAEALHRRTEKVMQMAGAILEISDEHGLPHYRATGHCLRGWAMALMEEPDEGIRLFRAGLAAFRENETALQYANYLVLLAEALDEAGRAEEALAALDEARDEIARTAEHFYEAELYRLKGCVLMKSPNGGQEAEACFQRAIEIASNQCAKTFELRAATDLARLLQKQNRPEEAQRMLAEIYGWFTEGFDTPCLKDAKLMLDAASKHGDIHDGNQNRQGGMGS